jgi:hypothetical protein
MAEVRISELTAHSTGVLAATDLIEVSEDLGGGLFESKKLTGEQLDGGLVWEALITQTSTNAPVLTVLKNTLGITASPTYVGVGGYTIGGFAGNLTGSIKIEKNMPSLDYNKYFVLAILNTNTLTLETGDITSIPANGLLIIGSYIKITKY